MACSVPPYLTFEAVEGGQLESLAPGLFILERFQQPLPLVQIRVSLRRVASGGSAGIQTTARPSPRTPLQGEAGSRRRPTLSTRSAPHTRQDQGAYGPRLDAGRLTSVLVPESLTLEGESRNLPMSPLLSPH